MPGRSPLTTRGMNDSSLEISSLSASNAVTWWPPRRNASVSRLMVARPILSWLGMPKRLMTLRLSRL